MPLRHFLIRLLLLAVFFNTAIGMPLHAAKHLCGVAPASAQAMGLLAADENTESSGHGDSVHKLCDACRAYAQQGEALRAPPVPQPTAGEPAALPRLRHGAAFVPSPGRWPFAARDPPAST